MSTLSPEARELRIERRTADKEHTIYIAAARAGKAEMHRLARGGNA